MIPLQSDFYPLSHAQERMWLLDRLEPESPAYNLARVFNVRGALSSEVLQASLQEVIARHESLRTTFIEIEGEPVQVIADSLALELPTIDLTHVSASERQSEALRLARDAAQRPFVLAHGPLLRAQLFRLSVDEHVLVLVMHHIVTDGWSMSILFDEIGKLYDAFAAGRPSPLPELPLQYGDYALWQRKSWTAQVLGKQLAYWRQQLAASTAVLELPADRSRPAVRTARGALQKRIFSRSLHERLKTLSQDANATLFMTLLAAWQTLLWRYTGRDDLVIGTPTAGRRDVELERLIGFFVNTLAIRTHLNGNLTFRELLGRVRETTLAAYEHQDAPFEQIIETLQVPRSLSYTPLFQVMFILQNIPKQHLQLQDVTLDEFEFDSGTAKFDLTVVTEETNDGLACVFEYNTDTFESETIARMLGHFQSLLEGIAEDPAQRLAALPLLSASERQMLLEEWNNTAAVYPHDQSINTLFETQAVRTPGTVALICGEQHMTYAELNARANQLAHYLRGRGVGRGVLVGLCVERSLEAVCGLLGILKSGAAYVALDPAYPQERIAYMIEDSQTPVVLTAQHLLHRMPQGAVESICLDRDWTRIALESTANADNDVKPQDPAYVMYTSGSTGRPKGVLAPHRGAVNRFAWMWNRWPFAAGETCCHKTGLSFVDSVWEIFGPLLQGVPSVIVPDDILHDPEQMLQTLATHRVTRIVLVPTQLRFIIENVPDLENRIPALQIWITSGEAITTELARRFAETMPKATLVNLYGSSEVAGDVSWYVINNNQFLERIPIGRPIANTQLYVLDREANPVPIGIAGEIYVGGDNLARGYLNDGALTAQKFLPDPFSSVRGARLYRTGDLGRFLADGNLEFLGRVDSQIKIRGVRIELSEIESILQTHPAIHSAAVAMIGANGDERLIGYVVPHDEAPEPGDVRRFLQDKVPNALVPASFMILNTLPLLPNGKVNRQALPAPERVHPGREQHYMAPRNPMEEKLVEIMEEVLKVTRVGVCDNFFDLGGHSLLGMQVVARVRRAFQVELRLRALFQEPTVAGLCPIIEQALQRNEGLRIPAPTRRAPPSKREQLLARLDRLTDEQVQALTRTIQPEKQEGVEEL
jgi:amino acid adenylation domain-containing protein